MLEPSGSVHGYHNSKEIFIYPNEQATCVSWICVNGKARKKIIVISTGQQL